MIVSREAFLNYVAGMLQDDHLMNAFLYYGAVARNKRSYAQLVREYDDVQEMRVIKIYLYEHVPTFGIRCLVTGRNLQDLLQALEHLEASEGSPAVYQLSTFHRNALAPRWYVDTKEGQETLALREGFTSEQATQYLHTQFARSREPEAEAIYYSMIEDAIVDANRRAIGAESAFCVQFHQRLGTFFVSLRPSVPECVLMGMALHPGEFKHMAAESLTDEPMGKRLANESTDTFYGIALDTVSVPWLYPGMRQRTIGGRTLISLILHDAYGPKWEMRPIRWDEHGRPSSLRLYHRIWIGDKRLSPHGGQDALGTYGGVRFLIDSVLEYEQYDSTSKPKAEESAHGQNDTPDTSH